MASFLKKTLFKKVDLYTAYGCFFAFFLIACLLPYYANGCLILGGEGDFVLDFKSLYHNFNFAWINMSSGIPATSLNFNYFNTFFFMLLQDLSLPTAAINFLLIFLLYFLPFIGIFLVFRELKVAPLPAFLISTFYIINPFTINFLISLNQWNSLILFVMPFSFFLILRYYNDNIKLFLMFGLFSAVFAFTNANPPLMVVYQLSMLISIIFIQLHRNKTFDPVLFLKKYSILFLSFLIFNSWWIFNWILALSSDVSKMYTADFAVQYARNLVKAYPFIFLRIFSLTSLTSASNITNYLAEFYNTFPSYFIALIPILIFVYYLYKYFPTKLSLRFLICVILTVIFLSKGPIGIFGFLYDFALLHVPLFSVFKTPPEKWGVLFIFYFSLMLIFILTTVKKDRHYRTVIGFFIFYLIFCSVPFLTSRFIPDYKMFDGNQGSRKFIEKEGYQDFRKYINKDLETFRVLSLPGSTNYQVSLLMDSGKHYTGMDPVVTSFNKSVIAAYSSYYTCSFDVLFNNLSLPHFSSLLSIFNIGKIVIEHDMEPWFGYMEKEDPSEFDLLFASTMEKSAMGPLSVYTLPNFMPRFYAAPKVNLIAGEPELIAPLTETNIFDTPANLLFIGQNNTKDTPSLFSKTPGEINMIVLSSDPKDKKDNDQLLSKAVLEKKNPLYIFKNISTSFETPMSGPYILKVILSLKKADFTVTDKELSSEVIAAIDNKYFKYDTFKHRQKSPNGRKIVIMTTIDLGKGRHEFNKFQSTYYFDIQWVILEPVRAPSAASEIPQIMFRRINHTKYILDVEGAKAPFWIVFSDTFHSRWNLYRDLSGVDRGGFQKKIVAEHKSAKVKEFIPFFGFSPRDICYLFKKPFGADHYQVNGYANAWYIDPKQSGLGENFSLTVFFWPQSLFYLGMGITMLAFICGICVLAIRNLRR